MQIGDLVRHKEYPKLVGVIVKIRKKIGLWDTLVLWIDESEPCWTGKDYLEVLCE